MLEKKQIDNENFVLYSPDSLKYITDKLEGILNDSVLLYKDLFDVTSFRKVQINYFDDKNKFKEYVYSLRGERNSLTEYAQGVFDRGMITAFIRPDIPINSDLYKNKLHMSSHELFHIMNREIILNSSYNRIVWFDEGMAQYFSKEFEDYDIKDIYNKTLETTKRIPDLNSLKHGNSFKNEEYDGYLLSYLSVRYLYETLGKDKFKELIHNEKEILNYGKSVIEDSFNYFDNKFVKSIKK